MAETTRTHSDEHEAKPSDVNAVFSENHEVHEQLVELARAVQGSVASAPSHDSQHDPNDSQVVYGLCMCVPQAGLHDHAQNQTESSHVNLLLLTARPDDQHSVKVMEVEGGDSIETRRMLRKLLGAMQKALAIDADEQESLHPDAQDDLPAHDAQFNGVLPHQKLSEREYQVVHMLSEGKTVGAISKELNLSVKTVSTYRVRALKKMNFKTNAELIRYMIQYKLG
jgi:two-component system invasion response regulator UvrY